MTALDTLATDVPSSTTGRRATVAILVTVYVLLLAWAYENIISPRFSYGGFVSIHPEPLDIILDALLCGVLAIFLPTNVTRPSELGRIVIFFLLIAPTVVIPTFLDVGWEGEDFEVKIYAVSSFLVLTAALTIIPRNAVRSLRIPGDHALYFLVGVALVAVIVLGASYTYGFSLQIHALSEVYDQRAIYSDRGGGRGINGLTTGLLQNALAPIFLIVGVHRRSLPYFAFGLALLLYIYSITALKSALVGLGFVICVYVLARRVQATSFTRVWSAAVITFVAVASLVASVPVLSIGIDLVVRRVLAVQGMLSYYYIDIFEREEPTYYSHTILRIFFEHPFSGDPADIVGRLLSGRAVHANASFLADGYVSGKLLGVIFATVVVALYLGLLDNITSELSPSVALGSTCMVIFIATQTGIVTLLLAHGGLALAACLWLASSALAAAPPGKT